MEGHITGRNALVALLCGFAALALFVVLLVAFTDTSPAPHPKTQPPAPEGTPLEATIPRQARADIYDECKSLAEQGVSSDDVGVVAATYIVANNAQAQADAINEACADGFVAGS
jgi:hypothetical protein